MTFVLKTCPHVEALAKHNPTYHSMICFCWQPCVNAYTIEQNRTNFHVVLLVDTFSVYVLTPFLFGLVPERMEGLVLPPC